MGTQNNLPLKDITLSIDGLSSVTHLYSLRHSNEDFYHCYSNYDWKKILFFYHNYNCSNYNILKFNNEEKATENLISYLTEPEGYYFNQPSMTIN